ncbi:phosphatase PAP2 family protein [Bacillus sp. cl95]|uniref:phosphatase PAP2 family protein n=2 Tax=unclassified Bacillus (in: firmicutes) TaxID=185979 RepID=UPI001587E555|nr:phosphatase PAP2 family protein [Bacillus sp. cl95]
MNRNWTLTAIAVSFVVALLTVWQVGQTKGALWFDKVITSSLNWVPESSLPFFIAITEMGDKVGIGILALITVLWLAFKKKDFAGIAAFVFAVALGNEVSKLLKNMVGRPRPEVEHLVDLTSFSFPSGHAMVGIILYFFIAYLILKHVENKNIRMLGAVLAGILILLIGMSRIVLHVHYASDVVGGYALGFMWVSLWIFLYEKYGRKLNRTK